MSTKVFVVMKNDYPECVFTTKKAAEKFCKKMMSENKPAERTIYWRSYEFELRK